MSISTRRTSMSSSKSGQLLSPPGQLKVRKRSSSIRQNFDDFEFDPLNNSTKLYKKNHHRQKQEINDDEKRKIKEAGQLASVFLEIGKSITSENNVDVSINERADHERDFNKANEHAKKVSNISKASIHRAEKVKLMFNLYYYAITESQKTINKKYKGVDGIYNPLQIIRNRKIRKSYGDVPTISVKTLPTASSAFSHNKYKLFWEVSLPELVYDATWRIQHWYELVNPKGELWFPDPSGSSSHRHHHYHRPHFRHHSQGSQDEIKNIHQKLFSDESDSEYQAEEEVSPINSVESGHDYLEIPINPNSRTNSRSTIDSKKGSKRRTKKRDIVGSRSPFRKIRNSSTSDINRVSTDLTMLQDDDLEPYKGTPLNDITIEPIKRNVSSSNLLTPFDSTIESFEENDEEEEAIEKENEKEKAEEIDPLDSNIELDLTEELNDEDYEELKTLNDLLHDLRYLNTIVRFSEHDYYMKLKCYSNSLNFNKIESIYQDILVQNNELGNKILTHYSETLKTEISELNSIQNDLINDYSTRVDRLLTLSDRTIGEVNTTLSLEIKRLTERFEKSSNYLFNRKTDSLLNFSYWLLENFVVLILWCIWIGFSIGRFIKYTILLAWRFLKWFIQKEI